MPEEPGGGVQGGTWGTLRDFLEAFSAPADPWGSGTVVAVVIAVVVIVVIVVLVVVIAVVVIIILQGILPGDRPQDATPGDLSVLGWGGLGC